MLLDPHHLAQLLPGWRQHYRSDGRPKRALTPRAARAVRRRGLRTYRCPLCDATHAATNPRRRERVPQVGERP
jgi:hypothetical protein